MLRQPFDDTKRFPCFVRHFREPRVTPASAKRLTNSGLIRAGRSRASTNASHCFGEAMNSRLSARICSACKQALSRMKSVTLRPLVSAPVRISFSCRSVARRLMRLVLMLLECATAITSPIRYVRTSYATDVRGSRSHSRLKTLRSMWTEP